MTSSPAIGAGGTVYIGSFDGALYALDAQTGATRWRFETDDHVYSSPALGGGLVYIASTDGSVYAVDRNGKQRWRYDTGDVVRSSPVLGRAPHGSGRILYVGSASGNLYALDARTGRRRWSYDTTPRDPVLRDRNDLNSSPALGRRGVYIGGEHGRIMHVPYDWCLRHRDPRCDRSPGEAFGTRPDPHRLRDPGRLHPPVRSPGPGGRRHALGARLVVRRGGETVDGAFTTTSPRTLVSTSPAFAFDTQISGDGHFLNVVPHGFLRPDTRYSVRLRGDWAGDGAAGRGGRHDPLPHRPGAAPGRAACARAATGCRPSSSAAWPCPSRRSSRASTRSASTATTWWWAPWPRRSRTATARARCCSGRSPPSAGPAGCRWPTAAAPSPSRSRAATATTR